MTLKTEKRCPRCGTVYPLVDAKGRPLPKEQLMFDRIKAERYRDGERLRSICKACHSADTSRRLVEKKPRRGAPAEAAGLTNPQAAELAGVSVSTVARAKRAGELPRELTPEAVEAWAARRQSPTLGNSPLEGVRDDLETSHLHPVRSRRVMPPKRPCPDGERWCPDCARERGGSGCTPLAEFGANLKYCRRHIQARKIASRARILATSEEARQKKRAADKRYRERHVAERASYLKGWKKRNPEKVAAWYAAWVKANPEKRKNSREAWRNRQILRADRYRFKTDYAPRPEYDPRDE